MSLHAYNNVFTQVFVVLHMHHYPADVCVINFRTFNKISHILIFMIIIPAGQSNSQFPVTAQCMLIHSLTPGQAFKTCPAFD